MHVFNISFILKNKLYAIIIIAIIIASALLYYSFSSVIKLPIKELSKNEDIFSVNSYIAEYEITEISNKNRNIYVMNEVYKKDGTNEYFKFGCKDFLNNDITYIVSNDKIKISNASQMSNYIINSSSFGKTNLFSLATYIDILHNINNIECMSLNVSEIDNLKKYEIVLDKQKHDTSCTSKGTCKYTDLFSNGLKLSKIELNILDNKPTDITIYTDDNNVYVNVKYTKFEINSEISSDIFKF